MNGKNITYWIATVLVCAFMAFAGYSYLSHEPKLMASFASLGYPAYFPNILGIAKILGVIALLVPSTPWLKEWAYAGFTFTFIGAACSHVSMNQMNAVAMPAMTLIMLAISYVCRPADRRLSHESEAQVHDHIVGLPVR